MIGNRSQSTRLIQIYRDMSQSQNVAVARVRAASVQRVVNLTFADKQIQINGLDVRVGDLEDDVIIP